jgi:polyhydroxybutyrate depolymerase
MRRPRSVAATCYVASAISAVLWAAACKNTDPQTASETNFLSRCDTSCADELSCVCGVCTRACSVTDECASLAAGAECVAAAARTPEAACFADESAAFCDLACSGDGDCGVLGAAFRCQSGYCRASGDGGDANGCPVTTLAVGDNDRTVVVGDTIRSYLVRLPSNHAGTSPVPLVLAFHPIAGTAAGETERSGYRELSEQEGFIVAWPQGIDDAWNIGPCCTTSREVDDVGFARALVQQLEQEACIDVKRVYAVGYAMGGGMAYHLACNAADVFAAVAPSAFDLLVESEQPCQPVRPVTVISFRGTADALVPYDGGAMQPPNGLDVTITFLGAVGTFERWAELNQCTGSPSAADSNGCSTYSSCADGVEVTLCTTQDGGMERGSPEIGWSMLSRHPMP